VLAGVNQSLSNIGARLSVKVRRAESNDEQERAREEPEIAQSLPCSKWPSLHDLTAREHVSIAPAASCE
jgi:hypothetical protein